MVPFPLLLSPFLYLFFTQRYFYAKKGVDYTRLTIDVPTVFYRCDGDNSNTNTPESKGAKTLAWGDDEIACLAAGDVNGDSKTNGDAAGAGAGAAGAGAAGAGAGAAALGTDTSDSDADDHPLSPSTVPPAPPSPAAAVAAIIGVQLAADAPPINPIKPDPKPPKPTSELELHPVIGMLVVVAAVARGLLLLLLLFALPLRKVPEIEAPTVSFDIQSALVADNTDTDTGTGTGTGTGTAPAGVSDNLPSS